MNALPPIPEQSSIAQHLMPREEERNGLSRKAWNIRCPAEDKKVPKSSVRVAIDAGDSVEEVK